jgi:hypothetical protein
MKASRRLGGHTSESRARGDTTSQGGTFNICPFTIFKPMGSAFRIFKQSSIDLYAPLGHSRTYTIVELIMVVQPSALDISLTALTVEKWAELQKSQLTFF